MTAPPPPEGFYPLPSALPVEVVAARAFVPQPNDDPFCTYSGSTPLDQLRPGTVLATRNVLGQPRYWWLKFTDLVIPEFPTPENLRQFVEVANRLIMGDVRRLAREYCARNRRAVRAI
jgi:hypothetical protein